MAEVQLSGQNGGLAMVAPPNSSDGWEASRAGDIEM
jgi:hypothetical protein